MSTNTPEPTGGSSRHEDPSSTPTWHGGDPSSRWSGQGGYPPSGGTAPQSYATFQTSEPPYGGGPTRRRRPRGLLLLAGLAALVLFVAVGLGTVLMNRADTVRSQIASGPSGASRWTAGPAPVQQADGSSPDWTATAAAVQPSVVSITVSSADSGGEGSGVLLDASGNIVTNHHVVAEALSGSGTILVSLDDKRTYQAKVVGTDPSTDLAVLSIASPPSDLRPITMGDNTQLKVGSPVMAVGNPLGLAGTVTTGIVSALERPVTTQQQATNQMQGQAEVVVTNAIQTSAAINPGNSGGALVNAAGQLIGINSSIASMSAATQGQSGNIGIGFAIPVNEVRSVSKQILDSGKVRHPFLGIAGKAGVVRDGNAQRAAAVITDVTGGSPAARAGLRSGDAIVAVDGMTVDSWIGLVAHVRERNVGQKVTLTTIRDGQRSDVTATLAEKPRE